MVPPVYNIKAGETKKKDVRVWSDAAGGSRRLGGFCYCSGKWFVTKATVPDNMSKLLLPRNDDQICIQELAAAVLCLTTLESQCEGQWITHSIDNNIALGNVISGASQAGHVNALVGNLWLYLGRMQIAWHGSRVVTVANSGDDPSTDDDALAQKLGELV